MKTGPPQPGQMAIDRSDIVFESYGAIDLPPDQLDVSVVIPCLNEARSIGICIEKAIRAMRGAGLRGEVVVADNGSTDGSIEIAEQLGARVIRVSQRGYGSALKAGI